MYRSALVATDGSETADSILAHVANVVEPGGMVYVLAVVDDLGRLLSRVAPAGSLEFGGSASVEIAEDAIEAEKIAAREHIADAERVLKAAGMTQVEGAIVSGAPGEAIVNTAKARKVAIVLIATHGRHGIKRAFMGSVSEDVLRHLEGIPVLVLNPVGD